MTLELGCGVAIKLFPVCPRPQTRQATIPLFLWSPPQLVFIASTIVWPPGPFPSAAPQLADVPAYVEVPLINIDQEIYHKYAMNLSASGKR